MATQHRDFFESRARFRPEESLRHYHRLLKRHYAFLVPPGAEVLEIGCGLGDLLAAVKPSRGVGIDFSPTILQLARARHPDLTFFEAEAESFQSEAPFDYILVSDLVNELPDVQAALEHWQSLLKPGGRLVMNFHNNVWHPILEMAEKAGWKAPTPPQNWLATLDLKNLLHLAGWETIRHGAGILWPLQTPGWERFCNALLAPLLPPLCLTQFLVARPRPKPNDRPHLSCTVVIPTRNEAGNIRAAIERTPEMGLGTEILFVEGHSSDNTWEQIQALIPEFPDRNIRAIRQTGRGKGNAVREAFEQARGDVLFILDGDLTMPPEQLPKFYEALRSGVADFVNGVRLVYPMEQQAMRFLNMVANHFFGLAFSWLIGQRVKDTLCGTKALFRRDYEKIAASRDYFGDFDPFGDFDLLFGAAKLHLKVVDLPIRYAARTYGDTNIHRWRDGALLFRMVGFALRKIKFIG